MIKKFSTPLVALGAVLLIASNASAAEAAAATHLGWLGAAAGFGLAFAAIGGAVSQGRVAGTALEGIARNPGASGNMFLTFILGMVLIESLVIYALVIGFQLAGKIPSWADFIGAAAGH